MSFLDNLENNLKTLEGREAESGEDPKKREADRKKSAASAPWAEQLKKSQWTQSLMQLATRGGYAMRTKINLSWTGNTLRLDARGQRLDLEPTSSGIVAVFAKGLDVTKRVPVDLKKKPDALVADYLKILADQKKHDEAQIAAMPEADTESE